MSIKHSASDTGAAAAKNPAIGYRPVDVSLASTAPPFSLWPLLIVIIAKPAADAFYDVNAVKYGYMLVLFVVAFFARYGQAIARARVKRPEVGVFYLLLLITYFYFLFGSAVVFGGSLQEIFKIISPFIFFALVFFASDRRIIPALAFGAGLVVVANAALLPFDYGWVYWGGIHTFKGFYYFKTDLAYSLAFSVLMVAIYYRFTNHTILLLLIALAGVEVVLANSRLNYLTYALLMIYIAIKNGVNMRTVTRYGWLFAVVGGVVVYSYSSSKLLGFDIDNWGTFTQGRLLAWGRLLNAFMGFSPLEWLFGRGMYADIVLAAEEVGIWAGNAHNEFLHLVYTQGMIGTFVYGLLWYQVFRLTCGTATPPGLRNVGPMAVALILLQGTTTVVSSYATKTWPLVLVLIMIHAASQRPEVRSGP
jgi:hypothetical protein